jgi:Na+/H+-dicarboxylate symporter
VSKRFTLYIMIAMVLGIITGAIIHHSYGVMDANGVLTPESKSLLDSIASYFKIVTDIFLRLIKMIIAPLVFSTLVVGVAHMGDTAALGRVGVKTLGWFLVASLVSLFMGILMVYWLQPGAGLNLPLPPANADVAIKANALSLKEFITHVFPKSAFEAMANNEILQIVVFSLFVGVAMASLGEKAKLLVEIVEKIVDVMLKITGYVMNVAPFAVFAALAATVTTQGLDILWTYGKFIGGFYFALVVLWCVLFGAGFIFLGLRTGTLIRMVREPIAIAFSTASSEAAYPKTMDQLEKFGVTRRISSFVLPLGYSFNLDGSMMYCTFATIFIAQAYGIDLTWGQKLTLLALLMLTSKGMAAVPRASLVVIAGALAFFKLPETGLLLILAVDQFLDMGRSATNVVGNSVATAVVAKWEGELGPTKTEMPTSKTEPIPAA